MAQCAYSLPTLLTYKLETQLFLCSLHCAVLEKSCSLRITTSPGILAPANQPFHVLCTGMLKTLPEDAMAMISLGTASGWRCPEERVTGAHRQLLPLSGVGAQASVCLSRACLSAPPGRI